MQCTNYHLLKVFSSLSRFVGSTKTGLFWKANQTVASIKALPIAGLDFVLLFFHAITKILSSTTSLVVLRFIFKHKRISACVATPKRRELSDVFNFYWLLFGLWGFFSVTLWGFNHWFTFQPSSTIFYDCLSSNAQKLQTFCLDVANEHLWIHLILGSHGHGDKKEASKWMLHQPVK